MTGFNMRLRPPAPGLAPGSSTAIPNVTLPRPSILGPLEGSATLDGFAFGSAALTPDHVRQLGTLAGTYQRLLGEMPGGRIHSVGHTDAVGRDPENDTLGQERADAARSELVTNGVPATEIRTFSLGETVPVVRTPRREPRNRRVELYFSPNSGINLPGLMTGTLTRPTPLGGTPPPSGPIFSQPQIDYCAIFPEECDPNRVPASAFEPPPEHPERRLPSLTDAIWSPIDRSLERGLRGLGLSETWNRRLRDAARAGAAKGAEELLDQAMDAADLTGETREAVGTALRAAVQLEVPF